MATYPRGNTASYRDIGAVQHLDTGTGRTFPGGNSTGYADIGATQHQDGAAPVVATRSPGGGVSMTPGGSY